MYCDLHPSELSNRKEMLGRNFVRGQFKLRLAVALRNGWGLCWWYDWSPPYFILGVQHTTERSLPFFQKISDVSFMNDSFILKESLIWLGNIESSKWGFIHFVLTAHAQHPTGSLQETEMIGLPFESLGLSCSNDSNPKTREVNNSVSSTDCIASAYGDVTWQKYEWLILN